MEKAPHAAPGVARTWILRAALICAGIAAGVSLTATSAFASGGVLDRVGDKAAGVVQKATGNSKSDSKSGSSKAGSGKSEKAKSSPRRASRNGSGSSDRPRANRSSSNSNQANRSVRQVTREVARTVRREVRTVRHQTHERVNRTEKIAKRTVNRGHRSDRAKANDRVRESKPAKTDRVSKPDRTAKAEKAQTAADKGKSAKSGPVTKIIKKAILIPVNTITNRTDTVLSAAGLPKITTPATDRVIEVVKTTGGQVDRVATPVLHRADGLVRRTAPVLDAVTSVLPTRPDLPALPGLPLLPELPGLPDTPSLPLPPVPGDASGTPTLLPSLATTPEVVRPTAPTPASFAAAPLADTAFSGFAQTPVSKSVAAAVGGTATELVASMSGSVAGLDGAAIGRTVGLLTVVAVGVAGALGASGAAGSGAGGLSFVAVASSFGFAVRPAQGRTNISALRLAAFRRPNRPGFAPD